MKKAKTDTKADIVSNQEPEQAAVQAPESADLDSEQWVSIQEYADQKHVSYQAIRQQFARYRSEIGEDHFRTVQRKFYMDQYAVSYLNEKRKGNPIIVYEAEKDDRYEELKAEHEKTLQQLEAAKKTIMEMQQKLLDTKQQHMETQKQVTQLTEEKFLLVDKAAAADVYRVRTEYAEKEASQERERADQAKLAADQERSRADQLQEELLKEKTSYQRTWFGLYKKI